MYDYHYGVTFGLPLMGHTGICHNFPRGTHVFCLSKDQHRTHMKPMSVYNMYCLCWANVWLPLWGHTWAATNGAHWRMQQFSTWDPCVLPLKVPIWDPHKTHVYLPSALPMLGPCVISFCEAKVSCFWRGLVFCPRNTHITGNQNGQPSWSAMVRSHPGRSSVSFCGLRCQAVPLI